MKTIFVIIIAGLLVGCSTDHPDSRISEINLTLPERWSASKEAQAGVDTNWIYQVGGQNGERIVKEALQSNPQLSVAAERVQQATALARTAKAQRLPSVAAGVDSARTKRIFVGFPFGGGGIPSSDFETFTSNFSVSWEPDIWGFKKAGQEALIANAQAEEQAYSAAKASLAAQVLRSWFAIAEANEQLVLVSEADQLYRTTLELVRERYEMALVDDGGAVAQLRIAESEVATNQERTAQYQGIRDQAIRQLETLLGRYPEGGLNGLLRLPKTPPSPPAGLPSQLLLRRPDILESERRFASAGRLLKQGKLAFFPSFTLTGSAGTTTDSLANIFNSDFGVWSLASGLFQPIWAGGALRSEYDRLISEERLALANLQSVVLTAFKEVESALKEEEILVQREKSLKEALKLAKSATESATEEYSAGTGDALTLITSQSKQIQLASRLATINRLRLDNRITLHLALGGDFTLSK